MYESHPTEYCLRVPLRFASKISLAESEVIARTPDNQPDLKELLETALGRIDAELRLILELKELDRFKYSQIAEIVGIPEGTVGSRLNRARRELRHQLEALGWEG